MKLYDFDKSGHAHRVRLFASLLGLDLELVPVDLAGAEHKQPEFLTKNPFGQVPVLEDGDFILSDSNAIIAYLAAKYDPSGKWLPRGAGPFAETHLWLSKAANELATGMAAARLVTVFGAGLDHKVAIDKAHSQLAIMNRHLENRQWLVGSAPTIADIAHYSYTAHAPEGGVDLHPYPYVEAWLRRIEGLEGFVAMAATETAAKKALTH